MWSEDLLYDHDTNFCAYKRVWNCSRLLQAWLLPWPRCWLSLLLFKTGYIRAVCEAHNKQREQPSTKGASSHCIRETGFPQWTNTESQSWPEKIETSLLHNRRSENWLKFYQESSMDFNSASFILSSANQFLVDPSLILVTGFPDALGLVLFTIHFSQRKAGCRCIRGFLGLPTRIHQSQRHLHARTHTRTHTHAHTHTHTHTPPSCKSWTCSLML